MLKYNQIVFFSSLQILLSMSVCNNKPSRSVSSYFVQQPLIHTSFLPLVLSIWDLPPLPPPVITTPAANRSCRLGLCLVDHVKGREPLPTGPWSRAHLYWRLLNIKSCTPGEDLVWEARSRARERRRQEAVVMRFLTSRRADARLGEVCSVAPFFCGPSSTKDTYLVS